MKAESFAVILLAVLMIFTGCAKENDPGTETAETAVKEKADFVFKKNGSAPAGWICTPSKSGGILQ